MRISVNGEDVTLASPCSVHGLLEQMDLAQQPCAVEVNAVVIPKPRHADRTLSDGDTVEIVTLVGGG